MLPPIPLNKLLQGVRVDRSSDVPYLAGYTRSGRTVFLDKDSKSGFVHKGRWVVTDKFVVLHEVVESYLERELGWKYQEAHRLALKFKRDAVEKAGIDWEAYQAAVGRQCREVSKQPVEVKPEGLDKQPYIDSKDTKQLKKLVKE